MASGEEVESINNAVNNRAKHVWTQEEDVVLVDSLYELYLIGTWKVDTGFRPGYLKELEKMLESKIPGCGIKGMPHCESRIRTLKKQTAALAEMVNNGSRFRWNSKTKTIECDQDVFNNWVKSHPSAKGLKGRPFPHFERLNEIYRKDKANGKEAFTPVEEDENIEAGGQNKEDNFTTARDDLHEAMEISTSHDRTTNSKSNRKRAKKSNAQFTNGMAEMSTAFKQLVEGTLTYLDNVGRALLQEETTPSREVAKSLHMMDILNLKKKVHVAKTINNDESMRSIFLELPQEKRVEMVIDLLGM